ncbi:MAG: hypothetical protein FJ117_11540 [Deltaproteobacteria bacterium]|nr:hypothetical protein [Deltaproteobacteria bacterium]
MRGDLRLKIYDSSYEKLSVLCTTNVDDLVKRPKAPFSVIPAAAGIQFFQRFIKLLDSVFYLSARHRQAGVPTFYEPINVLIFGKSLAI